MLSRVRRMLLCLWCLMLCCSATAFAQVNKLWAPTIHGGGGVVTGIELIVATVALGIGCAGALWIASNGGLLQKQDTERPTGGEWVLASYYLITCVIGVFAIIVIWISKGPGVY